MHPEVARALLSCEGVGLSEVLDTAWLAARLPVAGRAATARPPGPGPRSADPAPDGPASSVGGPPSAPGRTSPESGGRAADMALWLPGAEPLLTGAGETTALVDAPLPPRMLPGRLELGNALRPLRRTSPSPVRTAVDEEATAEWAAATGMVVPMVEPAEEPHFDLALVRDTGSSMRLWTPMLRELARAVAQYGVFRSITVSRLDSRTARTLPTTPGGGSSSLRTLLEPEGRRLIALVTDGVGPGWHDGRMAEQVHLLSRYGPVVIVHLLPRYLWGRTGIDPLPVTFHPETQGARSRRFTGLARRFTPAGWSPADLWPEGRPPSGGRPHAVPVVPLAPGPLNRWAALITGAHDRSVSASAWIVTAGPGEKRNNHSSASASDPAPPTMPESTTDAGSERASDTLPGPAPDDTALADPADAGELLDDFDAVAGRRARRLLRSLAVVPLSLSTMWLTHMVTSNWRQEPYDPAPLAEVFFSGLLRPRPAREGSGTPADDPAYEFTGNTRQILLESMDRVEAVRVFETVSGYVARMRGRTALAFPALLASPRDGRLIGQIDPETRPFAEIAVRILKGMGPAYGDAVRRIEEAVDGLAHPADEADTTPPPPVLGALAPARPPHGGAAAGPRTADSPAPPGRPASAQPSPPPPSPARFPPLVPGPPAPESAPASVPESAPVPVAPDRTPLLAPVSAGPEPAEEPTDHSSGEGAARQRRHTIAVLGAAHSGKTTFLAAAGLAASGASPELGRWNVVAESERAEHFLVEQTYALAVARRFPQATMGRSSFSYVFRAELTRGRRPERVDFALDFCDVGGREYQWKNYGNNLVLDSHLGRAGHLVILVDPTGNGPQAEFLAPHLERLLKEFQKHRRLVRGRLPHRVAFCVTKFDEPSVFQNARRGNWVGQNAQGDPCVPAADAEDYIGWLADDSGYVARARALTKTYFLPDHVLWYAVSAIGFHRTPGGTLNLDDCSNRTHDEDGLPVLRGSARPVNVLEPLIDLGRAPGGT
ncbi:SAV_2336 family protein [Streptomyces hirsutus]|uniref:SAV_2336 N-terminal domain-related protein n=1 Tax=Streptomyces hirsutus TaxID=35620 RepID=UPI00386534B3|nr:SAV_2336 family protein [Streptomyces hirsutus]